MTPINQNNDGIERYIEITPMLHTQLQLAFREVKQLRFGDTNVTTAYKRINNEIGIVNNKTLILKLIYLANGELKEIFELSLKKIKEFLSRDENLSENTRNQITTLFPKDGIRQRLEVSSLKIIPKLRTEINNISQKCTTKNGRKFGSNNHSINRQMGFPSGRMSGLCTYIRSIEREEIESMREFISTKLPDNVHEFPILFDDTLLESELNDIESSNNEVSYPKLPIEQRFASPLKIPRKRPRDETPSTEAESQRTGPPQQPPRYSFKPMTMPPPRPTASQKNYALGLNLNQRDFSNQALPPNPRSLLYLDLSPSQVDLVPPPLNILPPPPPPPQQVPITTPIQCSNSDFFEETLALNQFQNNGPREKDAFFVYGQPKDAFLYTPSPRPTASQNNYVLGLDLNQGDFSNQALSPNQWSPSYLDPLDNSPPPPPHEATITMPNQQHHFGNSSPKSLNSQQNSELLALALEPSQDDGPREEDAALALACEQSRGEEQTGENAFVYRRSNETLTTTFPAPSFEIHKYVLNKTRIPETLPLQFQRALAIKRKKERLTNREIWKIWGTAWGLKSAAQINHIIAGVKKHLPTNEALDNMTKFISETLSEAPPNTIQPFHNTIQAPPNTTQARSNTIQALPNTIQALPNTIQAPPNTIQPFHNTIQAPPNTTQARSNTIQALPNTTTEYVPISTDFIKQVCDAIEIRRKKKAIRLETLNKELGLTVSLLRKIVLLNKETGQIDEKKRLTKIKKFDMRQLKEFVDLERKSESSLVLITQNVGDNAQRTSVLNFNVPPTPPRSKTKKNSKNPY